MQSCKCYEKMRFLETNQLLNYLICNCFQLQYYYMAVIDAPSLQRTRNTSSEAIYQDIFRFGRSMHSLSTSVQMVLDVMYGRTLFFIFTQMTKLIIETKNLPMCLRRS